MSDQYDASHSSESSSREKVIEHVFVGEVLRGLWRHGVRNAEVLRAEVDRGGYDLVLEANGIMRHTQLKASYNGARTSEVGININLAAKPHGCVVWIWFDPDTLELGPFLWYGGRAASPMPSLGDKVGRHTRGLKGQRPAIRILGKRAFTPLRTIDELLEQLFGVQHRNETQPSVTF